MVVVGLVVVLRGERYGDASGVVVLVADVIVADVGLVVELVVSRKEDRYGESSEEVVVELVLVVVAVVVAAVAEAVLPPTYGDGHCEALAFHSSGVSPMGSVQL